MRLSVQSIMGATENSHGLQAAPLCAFGLFSGIRHSRTFPPKGVPFPRALYHQCTTGDLVHQMATYQRRGDTWRAIVRAKGYPAKSKTFPTKAMAKVWADRLERERAALAASGGTAADAMTLGELVGWYRQHAAALTPWGRSKAADLKRLQDGAEIAGRVVVELRARDFVRHAEGRRRDGAGPATAGNDLVWIRAVLKAGRASLGLNAPLQALDDAAEDLRARRITAKSRPRTRRLSAEEEARLLAHFAERDARSEIPMADVVRFALLTARRQEEITRLRWADVDAAAGVAWLDDVKHPRHKVGNRRAFRLLADALEVVQRQPRTVERVFPFDPKSIGAAFTRACKLLEIHDLRFHDLRHEATSRLFERGYAIHEVAQFTLHESWATLRRYTHLRPQDVIERPPPGKGP